MAPAVNMSASLRLYATIPSHVINRLNLETLVQEDDWPSAEPDAAVPTGSLPSAMSSLNQAKQTSILLAKDTLVSFSDTGERIVCASGRNFVVLAVDMKGIEGISGQYGLETVGQSSGCIEETESITAVSCIPLFIPNTSRASLTSPEIVAVGYSTGWLRIFTHSGTLLISQLLHRAPLTAIKIRSSTSNGLASNNAHQNPINENESDEEVMLLYADGVVVAIEGGSLWMAIRVCDAQQRSTTQDTDLNNTASFAYKKWTFRQESVSDVVSCGPAKMSPSLMPTPAFAPTSPSTLLSTYATARYISVGTSPMLSYHATTETSKPLLSAVSLATMVASATRVTSAVLGFAMSWWGASSASGVSSPSSPTSSPTITENVTPNSIPVAPGTPMPSILSLSDPDRRILRISLAPVSSKSQLAACVDSLGRVMLFDIEECEMVRMWKGIREGQCAWIDLSCSTLEPTKIPKTTTSRQLTVRAVSNSPKTASSRLFLVVYAPRRGQLEVWHMRHGTRVGAFSVGGGCTLHNVVNGKVGSGMVSGNTCRTQEPVNGRGTCFLVGPAGEIWTVNVDMRLDNVAETNPVGTSVKKMPAVEKTGLLTIKSKPKAVDTTTASISHSSKEEHVEKLENDRKWSEQADINNGELSRMQDAWSSSSKWASYISDAGPILSCIETVQNIEELSIRCALIVALWAKDFSPVFKKVLALVEKARKAPKDSVCVREVGMRVPAIISFLNCLLVLFNELEGITVHSKIGPEALLSLLDRSEFNKFSAVADEIKRVLQNDCDAEDAVAEQKVIDTTMILDHKIMLKILLQIFSTEIRMVRPSKLIRRSDGSVFGGSVFGGGTRSNGSGSRKSPEQRLLQDRENFLMKLIESNPKSDDQWGKIVALARDLNVPVDTLRSSRAILLFALDDDERAIQMTDALETGLDLKAEIFLYVSKRRLAKSLDDRNAEHAKYLQYIPEEVRNWLFDEQKAGSDEVVKSPVATTETRKINELLQRAECSWGSGDRNNKVLGGRIQTLADLCNRMLRDQ